MSSRVKEVLLVTLISAAVGAGATGLFLLIDHQQTSFRKQSESECIKVAKLSEAKDYLYDNYTCYLIQGNKLVRVNL